MRDAHAPKRFPHSFVNYMLVRVTSSRVAREYGLTVCRPVPEVYEPAQRQPPVGW